LFIPMKKEFLRLEIKSILKTSTQSLWPLKTSLLIWANLNSINLLLDKSSLMPLSLILRIPQA
jgi:hypothetical protein